MNEKTKKIWTCKIGEVDRDDVPDGADRPMREAVERTYKRITGRDSDFNFSGWGGELTEPERAVVEDREPSEEHYRQWLASREADGGPNRMIGETDALVWAREFVALVSQREYAGIPTDEGTMICWFANAMCAAEGAVRAELSSTELKP